MDAMPLNTTRSNPGDNTQRQQDKALDMPMWFLHAQERVSSPETRCK